MNSIIERVPGVEVEDIGHEKFAIQVTDNIYVDKCAMYNLFVFLLATADGSGW